MDAATCADTIAEEYKRVLSANILNIVSVRVQIMGRTKTVPYAVVQSLNQFLTCIYPLCDWKLVGFYHRVTDELKLIVDGTIAAHLCPLSEGSYNIKPCHLKHRKKNKTQQLIYHDFITFYINKHYIYMTHYINATLKQTLRRTAFAMSLSEKHTKLSDKASTNVLYETTMLHTKV